MQIAMWYRAEKLMKDNTFTIASLADARDGFNRMGWCGKDSCGKAISEKTGMNVLGTPFYPEPFEGTCILSGEPTQHVLYAATAYGDGSVVPGAPARILRAFPPTEEQPDYSEP